MHKIKVRGVIIREDKIFLVREIKKHFFYLPWWTLENRESLQDCLKREIYEELWVHPVVGELISIREFEVNSSFYLDVWFNIENSHDFISIDKTNATHSFEYYDEGFYSFDEMKWKDMRPSDLEDILNNRKIVNIL